MGGCSEGGCGSASAPDVAELAQDLEPMAMPRYWRSEVASEEVDAAPEAGEAGLIGSPFQVSKAREAP